MDVKNIYEIWLMNINMQLLIQTLPNDEDVYEIRVIFRKVAYNDIMHGLELPYQRQHTKSIYNIDIDE